MMAEAVQTHDPAIRMGDAAGPEYAGTGCFRFGYFLFILVNATLFIRPGDLIPELASWPIYEVLILGSFAATLPAILVQLQWKTLSKNPAALCVLGLLPAIALSHIAQGDLWSARHSSTEFLKVIIYFLLLISLVDSLPRLRHFLGLTTIFVLVTAVLALLQYHGITNIDAMLPLDRSEGIDPATGEPLAFQQLRACGIFGDPNDYSLVLVSAILIMIHFITSTKGWLKRLVWLIPMAVVAYAFALTKSRGGFLSLLAGVGVFLFAKLGWRRALWLGILLFPLLFLVFAGRQTNLDASAADDTFHGRVLLWREGVDMFKSAPLLGIGQGNYADVNDSHMVAHNSYVHAYAELGFLGGSLFFAMILLPILTMLAYKKLVGWNPEGATKDLSLVAAIAIAYAAGLFSLSRNYSPATFMIVGTGCAFCSLMHNRGQISWMQLNNRLVFRLTCASLMMMVFLYCLIRVYA